MARYSYTAEEIAAARAAISEGVRKGAPADRVVAAAKKQGVELAGDYAEGFVAYGKGLTTHQPAKTKAIALDSWAYGDVVEI